MRNWVEEWLKYHHSLFAGMSELEGVINLQDKGQEYLGNNTLSELETIMYKCTLVKACEPY